MNSISSMASSWASNLFTQLDTKNQGYIEKSDLQSAFSKVSDSSSTSVDDVFSRLDGDSDGKVTKDEMTSALQKVAEQLDSQFNNMRMQGSGGPAAPAVRKACRPLRLPRTMPASPRMNWPASSKTSAAATASVPA